MSTTPTEDRPQPPSSPETMAEPLPVVTNLDIYPPFDISKSDLDVVLRSSDGVNFHVLKLFLSLASPFFKDMFTLPQPTDPTTATTNTPLPVIPVSETSTTLQRLLMFCYPLWSVSPSFDTLNDVQAVLEAANKYDMDGVLKRAGQALSTPKFLQTEPLRVFAIACRYRLENETRIAARSSLRVSVSSRSYMPELEHISAGALQHLLDYHFACGRAAQAVTKDLQWITRDNYTWFQFSCVNCSGKGKSITIAGMKYQLAAAFWMSFMLDVGAALLECPSAETVMKEEFLEKAVEEAKTCATCFKSTRSKITDDMISFRQTFGDEVEKALSPVSFPLFPPLNSFSCCSRTDYPWTQILGT
jgi:hypothetical protein